ncbi:hypothetical protein, partial [Bacillus mycoides]|uniref:hypothetical protein n=1 Tax=Bacillus mycoides TaxID=1405 RepID=UPI002E23B1E4|nr:hypothetical protein [Bacillus mycoides]
RRETTDCSSRCSWMKPKAEAARSEQEGVGTPEKEALFASQEGVKRPTVLAVVAGCFKSGADCLAP